MDIQDDLIASSSKDDTPNVEKATDNDSERTETDAPTVRSEERSFTTKSINVIASTMGITNVTSEAAQHLADDLFYKVKELIFNARLVMYRNKQGRLTSDDITKALNIHGCCYLFGHDSKEDVNFIYVPKADVYCEEDPNVELIDLALSDDEYTNNSDPYIQGAWVMTESFSEEESTVKQPSPYYLAVARTIMSGTPAHLKVALSDLRTNPKIGPVCPYFLNLVALTVKKVPRDTKLTNALIGTVHAIAHNKYVDPSPYLAINRAANSLLKIVIEINVVKDSVEDLAIRVRAGLLLAKIITIWSIELKQKIDIVRHLLQHLLDPTLPLQSHYGAIVALTALGQRTLDFYLWPAMERYIVSLLEIRDESGSEIMIQHVMVAIMVAARSSFRKEKMSAEQLLKLSKVDQMLYASFGDTVTPFRIMAAGPPIYPSLKREPNISRLRLRIQKVPPQILKKKQMDVNSMFDISCEPDPKRLPTAMYYDSSTVKNKLAFAYATRNYRFCTKLYKNSPAGDLLTIL